MKRKMIAENYLFKIYGSDILEPYKDKLLSELTEVALKILVFFQIDQMEPILVNLFDNHEEYLKYTRQFYEPQSYSRGNFINNTINHSYDISMLNGKLYILKNSILHEFVHIIYKKIYGSLYDRIVWLDEGLAMYLSNQKNLLQEDDERFKNWFINNIIGQDKEIPKIEYLKEHGSCYGKFCDKDTDKYNGYEVSYMLIRYLFDTKKDILEIIKDYDQIILLEETIINDALNYYVDKFKLEEYGNKKSYK